MNVYVLFYFNQLAGIYSTRENAEAARTGKFMEDYTISEWQIDGEEEC